MLDSAAGRPARAHSGDDQTRIPLNFEEAVEGLLGVKPQKKRRAQKKGSGTKK